MNRKMIEPARTGRFALVLAITLLAGTRTAPAMAPSIGEVFWNPSQAYCAFRRDGSRAPVGDDPASWRFVFVTELVSDDLASVERGYMRLDGLLRELEFIGRRDGERGEQRTYRTLGDRPVEVQINMIAGESRKSELGQTVLVNYSGTVSVAFGHSRRQIPFTGRCGVEPGS